MVNYDLVSITRSSSKILFLNERKYFIIFCFSSCMEIVYFNFTLQLCLQAHQSWQTVSSTLLVSHLTCESSAPSFWYFFLMVYLQFLVTKFLKSIQTKFFTSGIHRACCGIVKAFSKLPTSKNQNINPRMIYLNVLGKLLR